MGPKIRLSTPLKFSDVKRIFEHGMQIAFYERLARVLSDDGAKLQERILSGGVVLENASSSESIFGVDLDSPVRLIVSVAEWRSTRVDALLGLFSHPFLHFLTQVLDVVACKNKLHSVNEFGLGSCIFRYDLS